jgi:hypothetical protein
MKYNASLRVGKTDGYRARILDRAAPVQIALGTLVRIALRQLGKAAVILAKPDLSASGH